MRISSSDLWDIIKNLTAVAIWYVIPLAVGLLIWLSEIISPFDILIYTILLAFVIVSSVRIIRSLRSKNGSILFFDNSDFDNWEIYRDGMISRDTENSYSFRACLRKHNRPDPHGGYKLIGGEIVPDILFSGWLYRPSNVETLGTAERLALEDRNYDGYGFYVSHGINRVGIERRHNGNEESIMEPIVHTPPLDQWYHFRFFIRKRGKMELHLYDFRGVRLLTVKATDKKYRTFDRVVIHGGVPYFIDDLMITRI